MKCPVCQKTTFKKFLDVNDYFLTREQFSLMQCCNCSFIVTDPQPSPTEIGRYYLSDNYLSHSVAKKDLLSRLYRYIRNFSIRFKFNIVAKQTKGLNILDIGCGTGEFLAHCKGKGMTVLGVEPNQMARERAKHENGLNVVDDLAAINQSPRIDCITMWHVLEHIHDLDKVFTRSAELLQDKGVLIIALPNCLSWDAGFFRHHWAGYDVPRHLYHFSAKTFILLADKHGFICESVIPQKLDAYYVSMLSLRYKYGNLFSWFFPFFGFISNLNAKIGNNDYSSLIFILKKKKAHF